MLTYEDESARELFAVYVRPEGEIGTISFYPTQADAIAAVGPGMPPGVLTHGDIYVEDIGQCLLFAPPDWPLENVSQELLVQLAADGGEIFIALTNAESDALLALSNEDDLGRTNSRHSLREGYEFDTPDEEPSPRTQPPAPEPGKQPCAVWRADGSLVLFADGTDGGDELLDFTVPRGAFDDEVGSDKAVVALLDQGWIPSLSDEYTWREVGDNWVINLQRRNTEGEQFLARYSIEDGSLSVTRISPDTNDDEEHIQLIAVDLERELAELAHDLVATGWLPLVDSALAAELSADPTRMVSPGWYPDFDAESDDTTDDELVARTDFSEWMCAVSRG